MDEKLIHGVGFNRNALTFLHLLFANDSLIFVKATSEVCKQLKSIFDQFMAALGHLFNLEKSSIFFSP